MQDIGKLIVDRLVDLITSECQDAIPDADPAQVKLVVRGEFQDDPEDYGVIVCVHRNDPNRTQQAGHSGWPDEQDIMEMGLFIGAGGSAAVEHWLRRFTVEVIVWPNQEQDPADEIHGVVMARVRQAISMHKIIGMRDDYGEAIVVGNNPVRRMKVDEGGGPDDEYSWRGFLYLEYKTVWHPPL